MIIKKCLILSVIMILSVGCMAGAMGKTITAEKFTYQMVEMERKNFKLLIHENPNYFGTLVGSKLQPLKIIKSSVKYEQLTCVGLLPEKSLLEATIKVNLPYGFEGDLCKNGSKDYVAFYIDYGDGEGFVNAGPPVEVNVHDLDAVKQGPVYYAVSRGFTPKTQLKCTTPQIVKVRAILSWEAIPTGPNFIPVWGNRVERWVQIKPQPQPMVLIPVLDFQKILLSNLNFPFLEWKETPETQLLKDKMVVIGNKQEIKDYLEKMDAAETQAKETAGIDNKRSQFKKLISKNINYFGSISKSSNPQKIMNAMAKLPVNSLQAYFPGNIVVEQLVPIFPMLYNTTFEELKCVGLYPEEDLLEAVIEIKKPTGYKGNLCLSGSKEYVVFYIDWGTGGYDYVATTWVNVHDIPEVNGKSLFYSVRAKIPNIESKLKNCTIENIVKVKAILSWDVNPTALGPSYNPPYGNVLTRRVQIRPIDGLSAVCKIQTVNGISIVHIKQEDGGDKGLAFNPDSHRYDRPFGGIISCYGKINISNAHFYRFRYREDNGGTWTTIKDPLRVPNPFFSWSGPIYIEVPPDENGWFKKADYEHFQDQYPALALIYWRSNGKDTLCEIKLEVADNSITKNVIGTDVVNVQLDNTAPAFYKFSGAPAIMPNVGVAIKNSDNKFMKCGNFYGSEQIHIFGNFFDDYFNGFTLEVFGGNISGQESIGKGNYDTLTLSGKVYVQNMEFEPLNQNISSQGTVGAGDLTPGREIGRLNLCDIPQSPQKVKCAYGIWLRITDRAIVGGFGSLRYNYTTKGSHSRTTYVTFDWDPKSGTPQGCN